MTMFDADSGDAGVVVLHRNRWQAMALRKGQCGTGAVVIGVQVVRDDLGRDFKQAEHARDGLIQKIAGRGVVQIADVG